MITLSKKFILFLYNEQRCLGLLHTPNYYDTITLQHTSILQVLSLINAFLISFGS
jgi:hypothetical protein